MIGSVSVLTSCLSLWLQMVGYYTIADDKYETLKVLRSYQYFATTKIWERVRETNWNDHYHKGGFIWHTQVQVRP